MAGRSPARFLAPLALVAFAVAFFMVVSASPDEEQSARPTGTAPRAVGGATAAPRANGKPRKRRLKRFYTVKPGDTPSGIAEKTGVALEEILSLNPTLDPQTLTVGTKIRLRR
jgi:LysM repeat protein